MTQDKPDHQWVNGIVSFMREATTMINPDEAIDALGIQDIEQFTESQLTHCIVRYGANNPKIKDLFHALKQIDNLDIRLFNSDNKTFNFFIKIAGGLYYAKSLRRLIKKADIATIQDILTPEGFAYICEFSADKTCEEDYPLTENFETYLYAIGYFVLQTYFNSMNIVIKDFLNQKLELVSSEIDISHLRIRNEYALKLAHRTRNFLIKSSE